MTGSGPGLILSTCMAPNMDFLSQELAEYLQARLQKPVRALLDVPWQERERRLYAGEVDLCWICGLPYVRKVDHAPGSLRALAAPVMTGERYANQAVYYSDVVVHRDSVLRSLEDLRGAAWAYNEPGSHSGYGVVRYALALRGESLGFFGQVVQSGAHQSSLGMILRGEVDGSAIDSTVLEMEQSLHPEITSQIRVIDSFGPSPIPPWVVGQNVSAETQAALQRLLTQMHENPDGRRILQQAHMARFVSVSDRDYDPIRHMDRVASGA